MKMSVSDLKEVIREATKIAASPEYMKKERVRERLQKLVASYVAAGKVTDSATLERLFAKIAKDGHEDEKLALTALKMIPFDVWKKIATGLEKKAG